MNIYLMIVYNLWLHITHIPSILINFFISWPHINLISFHLITVFFNNYLWFRLWLFIIWCGYSYRDRNLLIILSFIFISFFIWVEMYMNIIRISVRIFLIMSIMIRTIWPREISTWWVIIWKSINIKIIIIIIIWVIWHNLIVMSFIWLFLICLIFLYMLTINIRDIDNILSMFWNRLFINVLNTEWISFIINEFTILIKYIIPFIIILKLLSKNILNLSTIHRISI